MLRAALEDVDLGEGPAFQQFLQPHHHRRAPEAGPRVEHVEIEAEPGFEVRQLEQAFLEQLRIDIAALGHQHDADRSVAFVAHVFEDRQLAVGDQLGDLLDQLGLGHLIRDFRDDQLPLPAAHPLDPGGDVGLVLRLGRVEPAAQAEGAAPRAIGLADRRRTVDHLPAGGEIGAVEVLHQLFVGDGRIVDQRQRCVDDLGDIVAGDAGCHPHRNPACAIGEEVGEQAGEDFGLDLLAVIRRDKVDRAFVQPRHQLQRGLGQARFGVAVGGGVIAIDIAEVPLPFDQRIAQAEILREADHRVIDAGVAMRVILADHIADHASGFLEGIAGVELQLPHRPQQAAVDRLQPVAQVGQRAGGDRRQRIDEVPLGQSGIEGRIDDGVEAVIGFVGGHGIGHAPRLATRAPARERGFHRESDLPQRAASLP